MAEKSWSLPPLDTPACARRCGDGLTHWVRYEKVRGPNEAGQWLRCCDGNDDFVSVKSLPLRASDVTCVACVALETKGLLRVRADV